ncbi:MAG: hypothetical protein QM645_07185 [Asticcacaulis sp.]
MKWIRNWQWVENWREGWRFISTQAMALSLAISGAWLAVPEKLQDRLPDSLIAVVLMPVLVLGIIGRFVAQPKAEAQHDLGR